MSKGEKGGLTKVIGSNGSHLFAEIRVFRCVAILSDTRLYGARCFFFIKGKIGFIWGRREKVIDTDFRR